MSTQAPRAPFLERELPWLLTTGALVVAWALVRPFGDFALNDDWTYAHLAKHTAETGVVKIDVPIAPSAVGQALLGAAVVKLFGFSHTVLRLLTMLLSLGALWAIDRMLREVTADVRVRSAALLTLAFSPLYFYSATTFMNELHGWLPPVFGIGLWFWDRARLADKPDTVVTWWVCLLVALICGMSFWTRQFASLLYPAVLGATATGFALQRRWKAIARALPLVGASLVLFGGCIWGFFTWAKATGNFNPEFAVRIDNLTKLNGKTWAMQSGAVLAYMTLYFLPFLAVTSWRGAARRAWMLPVGAVLLLLAGWNTHRLFDSHAEHDFWVGPLWHHKVFPYLVNIVRNAGIGPVTLDDSFLYGGPTPQWPKGVWQAVELVLLLAAVQWSPLTARIVTLIREAPRRTAAEVPLFGLFLALGCIPAIIQSHQQEMVDRYHLPILLGLMLVVPGAALSGGAFASRARQGLFAAALAPLVLFVVLGTHDEFRWNDARWALINKAYTLGGTRPTVQAGYEVNCFWKHEGLFREELAICQPRCGCAFNGFCCVDDTWRVAMSVSPGYTQLEAIQPNYWLAPGPPVILSTRGHP